MPRYFFDRLGGGEQTFDKVGMVLANDEEARCEAFRHLPPPSTVTAIGFNEYKSWSTTIRREDGQPVLRVLMALMVDQVGAKAFRTFQQV